MRLAYLVPLTLAFAAFLPGVWFPHWPWDPGLYAAISLQAARTDEWLTLGHANVTYFNKPPLWFWVHALFVRVLGESDWALRMPDLLAAVGCVAMTVSIVLRLHGPRVALLAGGSLALCTEYIERISQFRLDIPVTLCMLASVRLVLAARDAAAQPRRRSIPWMLAAGIPIGLGLLIKPMLALVALVILAAWLACGSGRDRRLVIWLIPAGLVALVLALPWHLAMHINHGQAFVGAYLFREVLDRGNGAQFKPDPWYAYFAYLSGVQTAAGKRLGWGAASPWLIPLVACALLGVLSWVASFWSGRRLAPRVSAAGGRLVQFWTLGLLVGLSAFADKRSWYLAPVMPGIAWIAALWMARFTPRPIARAVWRAGPALSGVALALVLITRPSFERGWRPVPAMPAISAHLRESVPRGPGAPLVWNGSLHHYDGVAVYLKTGHWPAYVEDENTGRTWQVPVGAMLLFDVRVARPDPTDQVLVTDGPFVLVRRTRAEAARPVASTQAGR